MRIFRKIISRRKTIILSLFSGILLSSMFFIFGYYEVNKADQNTQLEATKRFAVFDNQLNDLLYNNIYALRGFVAYIHTHDELTDDNIYAFLDELLKSDSEMINNVGILKDTTIVWNYPYEQNKTSIGIDIAQNQRQKNHVLAVKKTLKPLFQGPIDLIQGGRGFSIRYPILNPDGTYWGQAAIILKADVFVNTIKQFEEGLGIQTIVLNGKEIVYGDAELLDEKLYWFELDDDIFVWSVGMKVVGDQTYAEVRILFMFILGTMVFITITSAMYMFVRANDLIKHEALHDHLTGLRNRNSLDETMTQVFSSANRNHYKVGVLLLDLNKFKAINDTYGHAVGDIVLKDAAKKLKQHARSDEMIFRVGGDEFLLVVPIVENFNVLTAIKERLRSNLSYVLDVDGYKIQITCSIGCAIYKEDGDTFDDLFKAADYRMYQDKNSVI